MYEYIFLNTCLSTRIYMYARVSANYMKLCVYWLFFIGFYFFFYRNRKKNSFLFVQGISLFVEILISVQRPKFSEKIILLLLCYWKKRNFRYYTYIATDSLLLRCQERRIKPSVELSQAKTLLQWFFVGRLVRDRLVVEQLRPLIHPSFIFLLITGKT